ncbi:hypothetical protein CBM2592_A90101 [Cupriavidus taiwanensis]|nr:hypothetical protein CBM2592_A90101 [Cupriavidus taiwanensis]SOY90707.1 hypothetical protein CBM2591_A90100 [Cupriavidus taiwanensis]SOZ63513.1 hypothetical protein CBM2617_A70077 [Cupriavidus taiwanensis]SOZ82521.1 hypothetical protein CBM2618_A80077 [Cupriavidus taiwanensis]SOZ84398.1 hypothetical protein CBM2622_A80077 [Cupriavidus taiwanensis]
MERRQPQYIECARALMRDHFEAMPDSFNVRMLATRMPEHKPAMITNALRHLEGNGICHAPGEKTYDGAAGQRRVAVMVWRKGPATGPRVVARKGGDSHVPPSEALKRLGLPSPHDKAAELQQCMAAGVPLENIAEPAEQPVYYVPRAWLDERAPAVEEAQPPVASEPEQPESLAALIAEGVALLRTLVTMAQRGQTRLPF